MCHKCYQVNGDITGSSRSKVESHIFEEIFRYINYDEINVPIFECIRRSFEVDEILFIVILN